MITNELLEGFILSCTNCKAICKRNPYPFPAFYEGSYQKDLMIIGQSPGVEHLYQALPPKQYLELYKTNFKICKFYSYLNTIGLRSDSYYFTNLIKCPLKPGEKPEKEWISNCSKYLKLQLELVKPKFVLLLSKYAGEFFLMTTRHKVQRISFDNISFNCIYSFHPNYVNQIFKGDRDKLIEDLRVTLRENQLL